MQNFDSERLILEDRRKREEGARKEIDTAARLELAVVIFCVLVVIGIGVSVYLRVSRG